MPAKALIPNKANWGLSGSARQATAASEREITTFPEKIAQSNSATTCSVDVEKRSCMERPMAPPPKYQTQTTSLLAETPTEPYVNVQSIAPQRTAQTRNTTSKKIADNCLETGLPLSRKRLKFPSVVTPSADAASTTVSAQDAAVATGMSISTATNTAALEHKKLRNCHIRGKIRMGIAGRAHRGPRQNRFALLSTVTIQHLLVQKSSALLLFHHEVAKQRLRKISLQPPQAPRPLTSSSSRQSQFARAVKEI